MSYFLFGYVLHRMHNILTLYFASEKASQCVCSLYGVSSALYIVHVIHNNHYIV